MKSVLKNKTEEVILLAKQANLGELGKTVKVKKGYARNFLIPKGKAVRATKDNIAYFEARRSELEAAQAAELAAAQTQAESLAQVAISIAAQAGEDGKLFGSVGTLDIATAVKSASGLEIQKSQVLLPNGSLRQLGEYDIALKLHADITTSVKLTIVAQK